MNATKDPLFDLPDDNEKFLGNPAATPAPTEGPVVYRSACKKCHGTGSFGRVSALGHSKCTLCKGTGFMEYKHDEAHRNARKERRAARKAAKVETKAQEKQVQAKAWAEQYASEYEWMTSRAPRFGFAAEMVAAVAKWGSLTEGQMAAVHRLMLQDEERDAQRQQETKEKASRAQAMDVSAIEAAFAKAKGNGLLRPKLRVAQFTFSPAPATGRNAGSLYVVLRDTDEYLGKITNGVFEPLPRACTPERQAALMAVAGDLLGAVVQYGRETGECGCCGRTLTDPESIARGIGPICADNFFGG